MPPEEYIAIDELTNPDFRPNRDKAKRIYRDILQTHLATTQPDSQVFDQEMIELMIDAVLFSRSSIWHMGMIQKAEESGNEAEILSRKTFAIYHEHSIISRLLNALNPEFQMRVSAGEIQYEWKARSGIDAYARVGGSVFRPEMGSAPTIWSESMGCAWNYAAEFKQEQEEDTDPTAVMISMGGHRFSIKEEPIRIDTMIGAIMASEQIDEDMKPEIDYIPAIAVHPMFRMFGSQAKFRGNGPFTMYLHELWAEKTKEAYHAFSTRRLKAYKEWRGDI